MGFGFVDVEEVISKRIRGVFVDEGGGAIDDGGGGYDDAALGDVEEIAWGEGSDEEGGGEEEEEED